MLSGRRDWLSITPEPERLLPRAIATLRRGGPPSEEEVAGERARAERLVLHGARRRWLSWLQEAEDLARRSPPAGAESLDDLDQARRETLAVIDNHNALMLGLGGRSGLLVSGIRSAERTQKEASR